MFERFADQRVHMLTQSTGFDLTVVVDEAQAEPLVREFAREII